MENNLSEAADKTTGGAGGTGSEVEGPKPMGKSLLDFLAIVTKWRKVIVRTIVISTFVAVIFALVSPKW